MHIKTQMSSDYLKWSAPSFVSSRLCAWFCGFSKESHRLICKLWKCLPKTQSQGGSHKASFL